MIFRKILIAAIFLLSLKIAFATPQVIIKSINNGIRLNVTELPEKVIRTINNLKTDQPDLYKIIVYQYSDHYTLFLLSGKFWKVSKINIPIKTVKKLVFINHKDNKPVSCPDENIQFVVISAYPNMAAVNEAISLVSEAAQKRYKTITILSEAADAEVYKNWLSCPNLKGFYSIGHGSNQEIVVGNEEIIPYTFFQKREFINKYKQTAIILNSCQIYNYPFGSQVVFGNADTSSLYDFDPGPNAYQFVGGYTDLPMHSSELTSACFVKKAIEGLPMDYQTLKNCIGKLDIHYQGFGIAYSGKYLL